MPKVHEMKESKFLKKEDVGDGVLVTVAKVHKENVALDGADPEYKWCASFQEVAKPMVLNGTNLDAIAEVTGSDDTDLWPGKQVVLYTDANVTFGGKRVGGIRVRAPKIQKADLPF